MAWLKTGTHQDDDLDGQGYRLVAGLSGDDRITAGDGSVILGGPGDDEVVIPLPLTPGDPVVVHGGPGDDLIRTTADHPVDTIEVLAFGGPGDDVFRNLDTAFGGPGDDRFESAGTLGDFEGGPGRDTFAAEFTGFRNPSGGTIRDLTAEDAILFVGGSAGLVRVGTDEEGRTFVEYGVPSAMRWTLEGTLDPADLAVAQEDAGAVVTYRPEGGDAGLLIG